MKFLALTFFSFVYGNSSKGNNGKNDSGGPRDSKSSPNSKKTLPTLKQKNGGVISDVFTGMARARSKVPVINEVAQISPKLTKSVSRRLSPTLISTVSESVILTTPSETPPTTTALVPSRSIAFLSSTPTSETTTLLSTSLPTHKAFSPSIKPDVQSIVEPPSLTSQFPSPDSSVGTSQNSTSPIHGKSNSFIIGGIFASLTVFVLLLVLGINRFYLKKQFRESDSFLDDIESSYGPLPNLPFTVRPVEVQDHQELQQMNDKTRKSQWGL